MSTTAQIAANQNNAQLSTGPKTESGKAVCSQNRRIHGLSGDAFHVLPGEDQIAFDEFFAQLTAEYQPASVTESVLIEQMAQSAWLSRRAIRLQESCFQDGVVPEHRERTFALYIRYQTTHERAFSRALNDLLKLRAHARRVEIGFESQKHKQAQEVRRQAAEKRRHERHDTDMMFAQAKIDSETMRRMASETEIHLAHHREKRLSGGGKAA